MAHNQLDLAIAPEEPNRRALILPGGGMRVAYQAGAVKALYDSGLRFSFADGASGGTMNLAALLSGITPDDLCRRWRRLDPVSFVSLRPLRAYLKFPAMGAFGDFDGIQHKVFPQLGIEVEKVRAARSVRATFNVCDFEDKIVVPVPHSELSLELLLAGISLPLLTPAVAYNGRSYTDAVWIRDSNLLAAVRAGANELWVIWCIGNTSEYKNGLVEQYVHMIEMSALGALHAEFVEITAINAQIGRGEKPYGHDQPIVVHIIKPTYPIPLDTDFLAGRLDGSTLIACGHRDASEYLSTKASGGVALTPLSTKMKIPGRGIAFRETMTGRVTFGATDPRAGYDNPAAVPLALMASIDIRDVDAFVADPSHAGELTGHVYAPRVGFELLSTKGVFRLFSPGPDAKSGTTEMVYEIGYRHDGKLYYVRGRKYVRPGWLWRTWRETTTLYVTVHQDSAAGATVAAGILRLNIFDLFALLGTLHATECERWTQRWCTVWRFARFFARELWRSYIMRRPPA